MLIVKYAAANVEMANGTTWVMFLQGMEGLLTEEKGGGMQVIWREIMIKSHETEPWRLFCYMPAAVELSKLVVIGYADEVIAWKQSHISPPVVWPAWLKERIPDPEPMPRRPRDK